jgi:hypothetical protein
MKFSQIRIRKIHPTYRIVLLSRPAQLLANEEP